MPGSLHLAQPVLGIGVVALVVALPRELARDQGALVGRADELATLEEAWERTRGGRLGVAVLTPRQLLDRLGGR